MEKEFQGRNGKTLKCFHCHKEGHFKRDCPERRSNNDDKEDDSAFVVIDSYDSAKALVTSHEEFTKDWILDNCCTFHVCLINPGLNHLTS